MISFNSYLFFRECNQIGSKTVVLKNIATTIKRHDSVPVDDASPEENINKELYLIKILQNLSEKDTNENGISDISSSFTNSLQKGKYITDETMETVLLPSKRDMGVLPPWNEFCRMMRITHCFHSRQS
ncbi:hypothetical protein LOTGIDRAFT_172308 [Lottia gigantea]|uniref:Uncharacterized protein n=1 Tax=Lottia gigantea TaxID=225164 RepID=V4CI85_LOTGI|nr:hypothetical protein LOTGIDRAFT_172308 [Lottia gigantea]ESP01845.1 hypothetical protein LOTGIDRAFT_172308 [Lottia gigantea]